MFFLGFLINMAKKNILEEYLRDYLDRNLHLKFDICTCTLCRQKMIEYLLAKIKPVYVEEKDPDYEKKEIQAVRDNLKLIFEETTKAIDNVNDNPPHSLDSDREQAFSDLLDKIREARGVDFGQYHKAILKRRIALRLVANMVTSYTEYLKVLARNPGEYDRLFDAFTINVSEFFRDPDIWLTLKDLIKKGIQQSNLKKRPLVIWSAACAGGEEPYSLAIIARFLDSQHQSVKIIASDIDCTVLDRAQKGYYKPEQIAKAAGSSAIIKGLDIYSYFVSKPEGYCVRDFVKQIVEFRRLDLNSLDYLKEVDIILCRNVFIYFTKPLQEQIVDKFYRALNSDGYLVIGKTETLVAEAKLIFQEIDIGHKIYQKIKV